jgi:hypothetical protein
MMKKMILFVLVIGCVCGAVYSKTNVVRECEVISVFGDLISVTHPNGNTYKFYTDNGNFQKGERIKVVFDEMYEWNTQYVVKGVK